MRRLAIALLTAVLAAIAVAACGSTKPGSHAKQLSALAV
jgi:hypothetical protein